MRRNLIAVVGVVVVVVAVLVLRSRSHPGQGRAAGGPDALGRPSAPLWPLDQAIDEAATYLSRVNDEEGRFEYRLFTDGRHGSPRKYNILRHAGSIYALGDYATQTRSLEARSRASQCGVGAEKDV